MAEEGGAQGLLANIDRRLLLAGSVGVVLAIILLFFLFRGCSGRVGGRGFSTIYSNLDLKEAAEIVTKLKELAIPYQIKDEGQAIAVAKDKADQARLGLAEEGLPRGGSVGWEIFDESRLGATDFDRRIQLIRAISGELGRTIRSLVAIEDARVQIVIPEQRLFETTKVPVTASVLLKMHPGSHITLSQVNGIVHLVASSVENLQPENVTVVSNEGHILAPRSVATKTLPAIPVEEETSVEEKGAAATQPEEKMVAVKISPEASQAPATPSPEELLLQARKEKSEELTARAKSALSDLFPANTASAHIAVELSAGQVEGAWVIQGLRGTILIDQVYALSDDLKKSAFERVAASIGYDRARGDRLELWRVPDLAATLGKGSKAKQWPANPWVYVIFLVTVLGGFIYFIWFRSRKGADEIPRVAAEPLPESMVDQVRSLATQNPRAIATLIERWLTEG